MRKHLKKYLRIFALTLALAVSFPAHAYALSADADEDIIEKLTSTETTKYNEDSYWSTDNAPVFYGATEITLSKNAISEFDIDDARFRIFARDFEDGDLTQSITSSGYVDSATPGEYEISYSVADAHGNETQIQVPVTVTDDENSVIDVVRTLYTTPSVWNMDETGMKRANYGDRQILGIYMDEGTEISARVVSSDRDLTVSFVSGAESRGSNILLAAGSDGGAGEWTSIINEAEGGDCSAVPFVMTEVLSEDESDTQKTLQIEVKYDASVPELNYYHYGDDENGFRNDWTLSENAFGVIENDVLTIVLPFADLGKTANYYERGFASLNQFLEYYRLVINAMDEYVGLSLNPEKLTDQSVHAKYLICTDEDSPGTAYYTSDHIGISGDSMALLFEMNWGGLHVLAHGYQGYFGYGTMELEEVSNNIIAHYVQMDSDIYFYGGDWLGGLSSLESEMNAKKEEATDFAELDDKTKLYAIVNLLDSYEGADSYAKIFSWYREKVHDGTIKSQTQNADYYAEAVMDIYGENIISYLEGWGAKVSDPVKEDITQREQGAASGETLTAWAEPESSGALPLSPGDEVSDSSQSMGGFSEDASKSAENAGESAVEEEPAADEEPVIVDEDEAVDAENIGNVSHTDFYVALIIAIGVAAIIIMMVSSELIKKRNRRKD